MPGPARQETDINIFASLDEATVLYRLNDSTMDNGRLAKLLELDHDLGDHCGFPNCCFYTGGRLVAIRTKRDEVAIFHAWSFHRHRLEALAKRIVSVK